MLAIATAFFQASELAVGAREAAAADEGELRLLGDDGAQVGRIAARGGAVQHHFGDRELALDRLAARLEINRVGEAFLLAVGGVDGRISEDELGEAAAALPALRRREPGAGVLRAGSHQRVTLAAHLLEQTGVATCRRRRSLSSSRDAMRGDGRRPRSRRRLASGRRCWPPRQARRQPRRSPRRERSGSISVSFLCGRLIPRMREPHPRSPPVSSCSPASKGSRRTRSRY